MRCFNRLVDHLFGVHVQISNLLVTAVREKLGPDHPVRRFLAPFMPVGFLQSTVSD